MEPDSLAGSTGPVGRGTDERPGREYVPFDGRGAFGGAVVGRLRPSLCDGGRGIEGPYVRELGRSAAWFIGLGKSLGTRLLAIMLRSGGRGT